MTNFKKTFAVTWAPKLHIANLMLMLYGLLVVVSMVVMVLSTGWRSVNLANVTMGPASGLGIVTFIWLAFHTEHDLTRDSYRLLPVSDTVFYLASLASSLVAYLYFVLIRVLVMGLGFLISNYSGMRQVVGQLQQAAIQQLGSGRFYGLVVFGVAMMFLLIIWAWVLISLIHLVINVVSALLPNVKQKVIKGVLAVILILGLLKMGQWLSSLMTYLVNDASGNVTMVASLGMVAVVTAAMIALNIYLMKNWVEARY